MLIIFGFPKLPLNLAVTLKKIQNLNYLWRKLLHLSLEFEEYFCVQLHQIVTFKGLCIYS